AGLFQCHGSCTAGRASAKNCYIDRSRRRICGHFSFSLSPLKECPVSTCVFRCKRARPLLRSPACAISESCLSRCEPDRESTEPAFFSLRGKHRQGGPPATTQDSHPERSRRSLFATVPPFAWSRLRRLEKCGPVGTARRNRRHRATSSWLR